MNPDRMNPLPNEVPKTANQTPINRQSHDAQHQRRLEKIRTFEDQALENNDPLVANLELVCSNLLWMDAQLAQEGQQLLSELPTAAERANCLYSLLETIYKNAKALHFTLEFLQRLKKAQNVPGPTAISNHTVKSGDPGHEAIHKLRFTVGRKAK